MKTMKLIVIILGILFLASCKKDNTDPVVEQVTSVQLNKASFSLVIGGREKLLLIFDSVGAAVTGSNWSSSDTIVATVDDQGIVTAHSAGETTITVNVGSSIKEQCMAKIIASPIKDLVMPEAKYPIAKDAIVFIQGEGFTKDCKIILRRNTNLKSASDAGDILAQIKEQTFNYIAFSNSATPGWYSVILEQDNNQFNLGNMDIETPTIPEYVYDKNKIFWEDTHWRRFQLRGKVKENKIKLRQVIHNAKPGSKSESSIFLSKYKYKQNGLLVSQDIDLMTMNNTFTYDANNRLIKIVYKAYNNIETSIEYTYGNHELYIPIDSHFSMYFTPSGHPFIPFSQIWIKGLTQIKENWYGSNQTTLTTTNITPGSNSATALETKTDNSNDDYGYKVTTYNYNGGFPIKSVEKRTYADGSRESSNYHNFEFSATGMPIRITDRLGEYSIDSCKYVPNCPFHLYSECYYKNPDSYNNHVYEYDKNWNVLNTRSPDEPVTLWNSAHYLSYDEYGNWTQMTYCGYMDSNSIRIYTVTRDFTYWE